MKSTGCQKPSGETLVLICWCAITAFLLLLICSRSSFLYPCNDWNDANSYFTMGKAMMNGQVIYRDLYDQKGPYLYLVYGIAYLLSHDSFAGVFVLEVIAAAVFLFSCYKTMRLYCGRQISILLLPVLGWAVFSSKSFYWGGAAEEFCLPLLGISLYCSLRYFKDQFPALPGMKMILLNGIFAGIIMQVKYTMLGFYFGQMAMIAFAFLLKRCWKGFFTGCLAFLGAMAATALPWLVYFGANGALGNWFQCYIYNNVFLYSNLQEEGLGWGERILALAKILYWLVLDNPSYFFFVILGAVVMLVSFKVRWQEKINLLFLAGFLFLGIYIGGSVLPYYSIPLTVFTVLGVSTVGAFLEKLAAKTHFKTYSQRLLPIFMAVMLLGSAAGSYACSMNPCFMEQEKDSYFLFQFRDIVRKEENPTLLNIGCLDAGLYTVADIMPTCKYFQTNGIAFEEMFREQEQYLAEGRTQFVLARDEYPEIILEKYELVSQQPYEWGGQEFTYYLFKTP